MVLGQCIYQPTKFLSRVRCDLKDSPISPNGNQPLSCTNCRDRRIKCVYVSPLSKSHAMAHPSCSDEYADVKTVKTLRRGRRLQQVEQVYGKIPTNEAALSPSARSSTSDLQPRQSIIPQLNIEFFASPFFARFNMQRTSCIHVHCSFGPQFANHYLQTPYLTPMNFPRDILRTSRAALY